MSGATRLIRMARQAGLGLAMLGWLTGCGGVPGVAPIALNPSPSAIATLALAATSQPTELPPASPTPAGFTVQIDTQREVHPISPMVYGVSAASEATYAGLQPGLVSWGGNTSTRYNWQLGNAWNMGHDYLYRNTRYDYTGQSASDDFIAEAKAHGVPARLTVPTLGWVAKDDKNSTCSFPLAGGGCGDGGSSDCQHPNQLADPTRANQVSDVNSIVAWMHHLLDDRPDAVRIIAMDNEPELWGYNHYDVHPTCTGYDEILNKYLTYASAIRAVAPQAKLAGPMTCCWYFYWNSAAGADDKLKHGNADFLPWFLDQVHRHDLGSGQRTLDVLDVHFYPEGLYNDKVDPATAAHRLRSTRSLWDPTYVDESWIAAPMAVIPRLKALLEQWYPGTRLGLSEWNWGAEQNINGGLAVADVLGILGREQLDYAAYWREPPADSPAFSAFKLYTNYDDHGSRFGDKSVWAHADDVDTVGSYAALGSATGKLYVMLVHKDPLAELSVTLKLAGYKPQPVVQQYQLAQSSGAAIVASSLTIDPGRPIVKLAPYSATLLVFSPQ